MTQSIKSNLYVRREPPLGWIVISRPEARNALTTAMWEQLAHVMETLSKDAAIRVILLTGDGKESFISGADIAELKELIENPEREKETYRFVLAALESLTTSAKPVIGMINGYCMGGGMLLAMSCDLRFAAEKARFAIPAAKLGVAYPPRHGTARLVGIVGASAAADILLSGRTLDTAEALRIGLVNRVFPQHELEIMTREYASEIADCAPHSLRAHKMAIGQSLLPEAERNWLAVEEAVDQCYASDDCLEGLTAFLEKRRPVFKGK
jgi:enoyl-CoA hydratase/carnithine racemase